jgi:hypothetical protein
LISEIGTLVEFGQHRIARLPLLNIHCYQRLASAVVHGQIRVPTRLSLLVSDPKTPGKQSLEGGEERVSVRAAIIWHSPGECKSIIPQNQK